MHINNIQPVSFKGIALQDGGLDYIRQEEGEFAVDKVINAQKLYENSKWKLNISQNGYSLESPSTSKIYTGPFTVRRRFKSGDTKALIVRMDKLNRTKYIIRFPDMQDVSRLYKSIKNASGLDRMLLLLSVLEKHIYAKSL